MLRSLYIKDYALIEEFRVEFARGLSIITGETGAGKSIVLGAFGLLLGNRASADVIRSGAEKAIVEAEFDMASDSALKRYLESEPIDCESNALIIRREVMRRGTSRAFLNDSPANAQILKALGEQLVDLHGQHEHQSLLRVANHIEMLDDFAELAHERTQYREKRDHLRALAQEIEELRSREARLRQEHDLFDFQLQEILAVSPEPNEDSRIESDLLLLEHAEALSTAASKIHNILYEADSASHETLSRAKEHLTRLVSIDPSLAEPLAELSSALASVDEVIQWSSRYSERVGLDPERLESLRERAVLLQRIKKKFGGTLDAVLQKKAELESKLSFESEFEEIIEEKQRELVGRREELARLAVKLSKARKASAKKLESGIVSELADLGIEHAQFRVAIDFRQATKDSLVTLQLDGNVAEANQHGIDDVEFFISTNAGEEPKPLARVASGGEISRVMLAIKSVLAKNDPVGLLIFDEIDIGVSGRVAQHVGRAMKALAASHQVLAITHLAQIAAFGDTHYVAEKQTANGLTTSRLRQLNETEHVQEVARLISGDALSASAIENARALIVEALTLGQPGSKKTTARKRQTIEA
ncbi:MAG: DNA repair protein RecN [Bacteroidota bacterium]|nr:DNA repair protein RecN [Bacteroidota bacterium]MDP4234322.1 DNA repair protein RecN [Bacteroidota bacterium]